MECTHPFKLTPAGRATADVPVIIPRRTACDLRKCKGPKSGPACPRQLSVTADAIAPHSGPSLIRSTFESVSTASKRARAQSMPPQLQQSPLT